MLRRIRAFIASLLKSEEEDSFSSAYAKFYDEMLGYGMAPDKIDEEFVLRKAHAKVRRIVSAQTMRQPQHYDEFLAAAIKEEGYRLQKWNRSLGFEFLKIMKGFKPEQILTPDAWISYVEHAERIYVAPHIDEDSIEALKLNYRR